MRRRDDEEITRLIGARGASRKERTKYEVEEDDFRMIPRLSDKQLSRLRRVGRPTVGEEPRRLIATRLEARVLSWLRDTADKKKTRTNRSSTRIGRRDAEGELGRASEHRYKIRALFFDAGENPCKSIS